MARWPLVERAFGPLLVASQALPVFAIAPLLVVWLGFGLASKVTMATLIIFFPVATNFLEGLRRTDPGLVDLSRLYRASPRQRLWLIRIPAALPNLAAGLRIAAAVAPIGAIVGEWVGSSPGLGLLILHANARTQTDTVFAALLVLAVMSIALWKGIDAATRSPASAGRPILLSQLKGLPHAIEEPSLPPRLAGDRLWPLPRGAGQAHGPARLVREPRSRRPRRGQGKGLLRQGRARRDARRARGSVRPAASRRSGTGRYRRVLPAEPLPAGAGRAAPDPHRRRHRDAAEQPRRARRRAGEDARRPEGPHHRLLHRGLRGGAALHHARAGRPEAVRREARQRQFRAHPGAAFRARSTASSARSAISS